MALSIADQIALDDALVTPADRLRIGKCNLRLSSDAIFVSSQLKFLWVLNNKKNVDYAYLQWEDSFSRLRTKFEEGQCGNVLSSVPPRLSSNYVMEKDPSNS
ncbi:hypothetical protein Tco_0895538 [Tanacetum coccineum]|uniref:Uncharacterized protein n=1 Tax=Tanacetum coccineum TaxID=301880 RepID=A0ABQ5CEW1_9ASTR